MDTTKPMDEKLRQRANEVVSFHEREQRLPTFSEMAELFGVRSKNAVSKIVAQLEQHGFVVRDAKGRLKAGDNGFGIRFIGTVEAGIPNAAEEQLGDTVSLDSMLVTNRASTYMLTVAGDSMIDAGIMPGDIVVVDTSLKPKKNDIVVACVDGAWTMKYYAIENGEVVLMPANEKYQPIRPREELVIHSVVTSSLRTYR